MSRIEQLNRQAKEMTKLLGMQRDDNHENRHTILVAINDVKDELLGLYEDMIQVKNSDPRPESIPISTLNKDGVSRSCKCGARHSMFPNTHMHWCPMKYQK